MQPWRELDIQARWEFKAWLIRETDSRRNKGVDKYHQGEVLPIFKGNPLDQAIEEALDLVFYLWVAKRKQNEETSMKEQDERKIYGIS